MAPFAEVHRSIVQGRVETPKSGKTRRVDLSLQLVEVLRGLRTEQRKEALASGDVPSTRLFPKVDPNNFRRREWRRMLQKADLRHVPIKALRHTFASLHIARGESLAYVRDQLGHHSIQITVDHYGHLVPGGNRAAADGLDDVLSTQQSATPAQPAVG
jgi:integrase